MINMNKDLYPKHNIPPVLMNFKVDPKVKEAAEVALGGLGLSTSAYLGMCLKKIAQDRTMPFELKIDPEFWSKQEKVIAAVSQATSPFLPISEKVLEECEARVNAMVREQLSETDQTFPYLEFASEFKSIKGGERYEFIISESIRMRAYGEKGHQFVVFLDEVYNRMNTIVGSVIGEQKTRFAQELSEDKKLANHPLSEWVMSFLDEADPKETLLLLTSVRRDLAKDYKKYKDEINLYLSGDPITRVALRSLMRRCKVDKKVTKIAIKSFDQMMAMYFDEENGPDQEEIQEVERYLREAIANDAIDDTERILKSLMKGKEAE